MAGRGQGCYLGKRIDTKQEGRDSEVVEDQEPTFYFKVKVHHIYHSLN